MIDEIEVGALGRRLWQRLIGPALEGIELSAYDIQQWAPNALSETDLLRVYEAARQRSVYERAGYDGDPDDTTGCAWQTAADDINVLLMDVISAIWDKQMAHYAE